MSSHEQKENAKKGLGGFLKKLADKLDKKMAEAAKSKDCCCRKSSGSKDSSCCS